MSWVFTSFYFDGDNYTVHFWQTHESHGDQVQPHFIETGGIVIVTEKETGRKEIYLFSTIGKEDVESGVANLTHSLSIYVNGNKVFPFSKKEIPKEYVDLLSEKIGKESQRSENFFTGDLDKITFCG